MEDLSRETCLKLWIKAGFILAALPVSIQQRGFLNTGSRVS
jgi:hypothetical protein